MGDGLGGIDVLIAAGFGWRPVGMAWVCLLLVGGWMAAA